MRALAGALALLFAGQAGAQPRTILFVGNSFTFGDRSPVRRYRPESVHDLNGEGLGGVPALFKTFSDEAGLAYDVSLETSPGKPLSFHYDEKRALIAKPWDVVVLQGYSTLDPDAPGNPARHIDYARRLAGLMRAANPKVEVDLVATWSRADQTYRPTGHWYGKPITAMAEDLERATNDALHGAPDLHAAIPVGAAWQRAMATGLADPNPYDGVDFGKIDLWTWDQYHASAEGYYLEALIMFGTITGRDPRSLGDKERAADDLGMAPATIKALQDVAAAELDARRR